MAQDLRIKLMVGNEIKSRHNSWAVAERRTANYPSCALVDWTGEATLYINGKRQES